MAVHRSFEEAPLRQPLLGDLYIRALGAVRARRRRGRGLDRQVRAALQKFARLGVGHAGGFQTMHLLELQDRRFRGRAEHAVSHAGQIGQLDEFGLHAENDVGGRSEQLARLRVGHAGRLEAEHLLEGGNGLFRRFAEHAVGLAAAHARGDQAFLHFQYALLRCGERGKRRFVGIAGHAQAVHLLEELHGFLGAVAKVAVGSAGKQPQSDEALLQFLHGGFARAVHHAVDERAGGRLLRGRGGGAILRRGIAEKQAERQ